MGKKRFEFQPLNDGGMNISWGDELDDGIGLFPFEVEEILKLFRWRIPWIEKEDRRKADHAKGYVRIFVCRACRERLHPTTPIPDDDQYRTLSGWACPICVRSGEHCFPVTLVPVNEI